MADSTSKFTTSRQRFEKFRQAYRAGKTKELVTDPALLPETNGSGTDKDGQRDQGERRRYLHHYLRWLAPYRSAVAVLILLAVIGAAFEMAKPLFMRHIIDNILLVEGLETSQRMTQLHLVGAAFLLVIVVARFLDSTRNLRQKLLNVRVVLSLRRKLYDRLLHLPLANLTEMKTGGVISRLTSDINRTSGLMQLAIVSPGVSALRLLFALGILLTINWRLAAMAMTIIPPAVLLSMMVTRRVRPIYRSMHKENAAIDARISETFGGIRVVRSFQRENREASGYATGLHTVLRKDLFAHRRELILWSTWGFLLASLNVVIVWMGGGMQIAGTATVGDIMAFQWYTLMLLEPVWSIVNSFSEMQRSLASMERVFEVLDTPIDKPDKASAIAAPRRVDEIRLEKVGFAYNEGQPVLHDLDLTVPGGSVVALVGRSGAGKTTVTDLIARFHDPTTGRITLNGVDLRDMRLASYRKLLGIVQQEVFLFDGTVRENIAYGRPHASEEEVLDAAMRANAHEFISELTDGYESRIGERGVKLSGGQAQRLSIARAILADPQILILDEATSNLDSESEQLIQQSLDELMRPEDGHARTTFVIAHRLSTVASADLILVMESGRIIQRGTHQELLSQEGLYQEMVTRQQDAIQSGLLVESP